MEGTSTSTQKFLITTFQAVDILVKQLTEIDFDTALENFRTSFKNSKISEPTFWEVKKQPDIGSGRKICNQSDFQYCPYIMERLAKIPKKS